MSEWRIYRGTRSPHPGIDRLPPPPDWRTFDDIAGRPAAGDSTGWSRADLERGSRYSPIARLLDPVNAALYLRRPLLVSGDPGVGKSTLAYSVAYELGLGPVLRWPITSSSSLKEGLYRYDAIGRLQEVRLRPADAAEPPHVNGQATEGDRIGRYIRLGPLGTALLPTNTPRVLLIDEIDKAGMDLPNDLLSTFEEGEYEIDELVRIADTSPRVRVFTADRQQPEASTANRTAEIPEGLVRCRQFPLVIMTSNGEREFPPAFLRRCLTFRIRQPGTEQLAAIVEAQLGDQLRADPQVAAQRRSMVGQLISQFHQRSEEGQLLATDQLLNAIHLTSRNDLNEAERDQLTDLLLHNLTADPA
jgi:MoxR-like ATPase